MFVTRIFALDWWGWPMGDADIKGEILEGIKYVHKGQLCQERWEK